MENIDLQNSVVTACPKCYDPNKVGVVNLIMVSDKPGHVYCESCSDYPRSEIWAHASSKNK